MEALGCMPDLIIVLLLLTTLYLKNRSKDHIIKLQQALSSIERLKFELAVSSQNAASNSLSDGSESITDNTNFELSVPHAPKEYELREQLKNELLRLYERSQGSTTISPLILQSEAYAKLQALIQAGKTIRDDDQLWSDIEQTVLLVSPRFKTNLTLLTSGNLTRIDLHTALLIKCGIKPSQMTILVGRSNGAIVSRRESLCMKILDEKKGTKVIDSIIRSL
jgi:hypothetical protein